MKTKGFTVHMDDGRGRGYGICGTKAREFMGIPGLSRNPFRVTCPKCERIQMEVAAGESLVKQLPEAR